MVIEGLSEHIAGEVVVVTVKIFNTSSVPISRVALSSTLCQYMLLCDSKV